MALTCLVGTVFFPILGFEFVDIDVGQQVVDNLHIRGLSGENLKHIFTSQCIYSYYPIRTLTFALDYEIWGLNPTGFKLTNGLLHLANVLLVFWLILRFFRHPASGEALPGTWRDVIAATFSAGIFAVHPVVVEPVSWVAGREELLMTLGALGCIHFHLRAQHLGEDGRKNGRAAACHVWATLCCGLACLCNAVGAIIPALIVAWDLLTANGPKTWRIVRGTSAMWVISVATIVTKKLGANPEAVAIEPDIFSSQWVKLILNVYWVNLRTLAWPTKLAVSRSPLGPEDVLPVNVLLGGLAIGLTGMILWYLRRRKLIIFGLAWFGLALGPALQIMSHHIHLADRFLYLPLAGLVTAAAVGLRPLARDSRSRKRGVGLLVAAVLGTGLLIAISARQVQTWQNGVSMWEHCLSLDPNNAMAHDSFGNLLTNRGDLERAAFHFKRAEQLDANNPEILYIVSKQLARFEDERLRNYPEAVRRARRACELSQWKNARYRRGLALVHTLYAESLENLGRFGLAKENYIDAIKADSSFDVPVYGLALLLATCPDESLCRPEKAVVLAERAQEIAENPTAVNFSILGEVYAAAGQYEEAIAASQKALQLSQAAGGSEVDDAILSQLRRFREDASNRSSP